MKALNQQEAYNSKSESNKYEELNVKYLVVLPVVLCALSLVARRFLPRNDLLAVGLR